MHIVNRSDKVARTADASRSRFGIAERGVPRALRRALGPTLALAVLVVPASAHAADEHSGWGFNFTPVLLPPSDEYRLGGGLDPELKYTRDLGGARLGAGARIGGYYAKNRFAVTAMPTLRLTVPVGPVEPYVSFGMGYGWIPSAKHDDVATMSRLGVVFRVTERVAIGIEGTVQKIDDSEWRFPSFGSAISFGF